VTWNDWLKDGRIEAHRPALEEVVAQRRAAERSLTDAALPGLSPEGRFRLAYDAGLALATLVVLASGHRVKSRVGHHQITIEAAGVVLGKEAAVLVKYLDLCRRTRNVISYEGDEIGAAQSGELLKEVARLSELVDAWLVKHHPELA
jgi:energy-converting hydrogenase Eha subunit A